MKKLLSFYGNSGQNPADAGDIIDDTIDTFVAAGDDGTAV
jgi:hypothetical protein